MIHHRRQRIDQLKRLIEELRSKGPKKPMETVLKMDEIVEDKPKRKKRIKKK